ncbi:MAG: hypothetical protein JXC33_14210, partial [Deltaproteobacteria bacterium]|nr:hypothetical protein [Deltaproteobacteria bacterium]
MAKTHEVLLQLTDEEKRIFHTFIAFPDFFSVDWFSGIPDFVPSKVISVILLLDRQKWILPKGGEYYQWSKHFPREKIVSEVPDKEMSR